MNEQQETLISKAPELYRDLFRRVFNGTAGRAHCVKAKCLSCCNFQRSEVRDCTVLLCPLHAFRPYQDKSDDDEGVNEI